MASVRENRLATGERTWTVLYRNGNRQTSDTFRDQDKAEKFRQLVPLIGPERALAAVADEDQWKGALTVDELAERFFTWKKRDVTSRTLEDYRRDHANWIRPWFGHKATESINEVDVQEWVDHMATSLAPKSVADRHMLLHSMYDFGRAKVRRLVDHNPCLETDLPKRNRRRAKGTTIPQWRALLDVAAARNPDAYDLVRFLGAVGWRFSEAIALPVANIEQRDDRVWVDMTQVFRMAANRQVLTPDAAKSFAGFRRVPVPDDETAEMLLRRTVGKRPNDLVFANSRGRHWNQNTFLRDTWPALLKDAGLWLGPRKSPTPHWLRHMAVAVLAAAGASASEIQRYIGHEDISTTMGTYGGMLGGMSEGVLVNASRILAGEGERGLVVSGEVLDTQTEQRLLGGVQVLQSEVDPVLRELEQP